MIKIVFFFVWIIFLTAVKDQTIYGNLSILANQSIKLEDFNGMKTYPISEAKCDRTGNFTLH